MRGGLWPFVAWLLALKIFCFWFDLKNPAKPFEVYRYWVVVVQISFYISVPFLFFNENLKKKINTERKQRASYPQSLLSLLMKIQDLSP